MLFALHPLTPSIGPCSNIRGYGLLAFSVRIIQQNRVVQFALLPVLHNAVPAPTLQFNHQGQIRQLRMKAVHLHTKNRMGIQFLSAELALANHLDPKIQFLQSRIHHSVGLDDAHLVIGGRGHAPQTSAQQGRIQILEAGGSALVLDNHQGGIDLVNGLGVFVEHKGPGQPHHQGHDQVRPEIEELVDIHHGVKSGRFLFSVGNGVLGFGQGRIWGDRH